MSKFLYISGEDYAAVDFEQARDDNLVDPAQLWDEAVVTAGTHRYDDGDLVFQYEALSFDEVDPEFLRFVQDELVDYDDLKSANIYPVD